MDRFLGFPGADRKCCSSKAAARDGRSPEMWLFLHRHLSSSTRKVRLLPGRLLCSPASPARQICRLRQQFLPRNLLSLHQYVQRKMQVWEAGACQEVVPQPACFLQSLLGLFLFIFPCSLQPDWVLGLCLAFGIVWTRVFSVFLLNASFMRCQFIRLKDVEDPGKRQENVS